MLVLPITNGLHSGVNNMSIGRERAPFHLEGAKGVCLRVKVKVGSNAKVNMALSTDLL